MADIASLSLGDAYVDIMGNTNKLASDLARAQGMVGGFMKNVLTGAAIASPFLLAGGVIMTSFKGWMEEETVLARMVNMFDAVGLKASELAPKISALGMAMMKTTTMTHEQVEAMATQAAQMGVSAKNIEPFIKAAIGMGARIGRDPESAMQLIIRASQGHMTMLSRMGIQIDTTKSKQDQFNQVLAFAAKGMGVAFKETNTLAGGFKQLRNSFGEIFDTLGKGLFEKSGLNKEIKKVTASVFAIIASIEKGFANKTFKGFNFEGLGDWIGDLLIRFTAMLMTIPEVFKLLKEVFSDPKKFLSVLGDGMVAMGKTLLKILIEGFAAMKPLFVMLGITMYQTFADNIGNLFEKAFESHPYLKDIFGPIGSLFKMPGNAMRDASLKGLNEKDLGAVFREVMMGRFKGTEYQKEEQLGTMTGAFKYSNEATGKAEWSMPTVERMLGMLKTESGEAVDQAIRKQGWGDAISKAAQDVKDIGVTGWTELKAEFEEIVKKIGSGVTANPVEQFKGFYQQLLVWMEENKRKAGVAGKGSGVDINGMAQKSSFSVISMADQWKKLQEGITKDKDAATTAKNTGEIATHVKKMAETMGVAPKLPTGSYHLFSLDYYGGNLGW